MSDTIIVLDDLTDLRCPYGHPLRSFQTKDLDQPYMNTYLVQGGLLYLALRGGFGGPSDDDTAAWRIQEDEAILQHRFKLRALPPPRTVRIYGHCGDCEPVLVRRDEPASLHDIVSEHQLFVDFILTFRAGEPLRIERVSGDREEIKANLVRRGLFVLDEQDPLSVAHRAVKRAQEKTGRRDFW